jgi:hypothetical protein
MAAREQPRYALAASCQQGEAPVTTGSHDPAAVGRDRLRAGHADREQVIETLKTAYVQGQLTKDELDTRAGQALTARTYADLAALTADIPPEPPAARLAHPPAPARRRPLARAAAKSGGCLVIAAAAVRVVGLADPGNTPGPIPKFWAFPCFFLALAAVLAALGFLVDGVVTSVEQWRSRRRLPPRAGPGGHDLGGGRRGGIGHGPVSPAPRTDQTRADLRARSRGSVGGTFPPGRAGHPVA